MFVQNFKNFMLYSQNGGRGSNAHIRALDGQYNPYTTDDVTSANTGYKTLFERTTIDIGTGTTDPSINDYKLAAALSAATVTRTVTKTLYELNGVVVCKYTLSGVNNSSSTITISEVAWQKTVSSYTTSYSGNAIFARSLLAQPISVGPGKNFVVEYEVQII